MKRPSRILTKRLEIRPLKASDYRVWKEAYLAHRPERAKHDLKLPKDASFSREAFLRVVAKQRELAKIDRVYVFALFHRKTREYLGHIDIAVIERRTMHWANLGYGILNQHYGNGYGREAALAAIGIGFKHLKLHRLEAVINTDNLKSLKLARKIGMKPEGTRRAFMYEDGKWQDHRVFSAIPEDIGMRSKRPAKGPF